MKQTGYPYPKPPFIVKKFHPPLGTRRVKPVRVNSA